MVHAAISDAGISQRRCTKVNPNREPMTMEAIRHNPSTQPENPM